MFGHPSSSVRIWEATTSMKASVQWLSDEPAFVAVDLAIERWREPLCREQRPDGSLRDCFMFPRERWGRIAHPVHA
jgi:hypothetical protein